MTKTLHAYEKFSNKLPYIFEDLTKHVDNDVKGLMCYLQSHIEDLFIDIICGDYICLVRSKHFTNFRDFQGYIAHIFEAYKEDDDINQDEKVNDCVKHAAYLDNVVSPRLYEEFMKIFS